MPRLPRFNLPGIAQHIVQRGNNHGVCFFDDAGRMAYQDWLREAAAFHGVAVHAYALMTNHIHLLATPELPGAISAMMQTLGRTYVRYVNRKHRRSGTLWEGRHKACVVDTERYILTAYRYIDLNPVRARIVLDPGDYRWSSYRANAGLCTDPLLRAHEGYTALGATAQEWAGHYRELCEKAIDPQDLAELRTMSRKELAYGSESFKNRIAIAAQRHSRSLKRGPSKRIRSQ